MLNSGDLYLLTLTLRDVLRESDDLRRPPWRGAEHPMAGHCYVASEALYHLGARELGYCPATVQVGDVVHWFLKGGGKFKDRILDPTVDQFSKTPPHARGRGRGFLTRIPSRRCRILLERLDAVRLVTTPGRVRDALDATLINQPERRTA